MLSGLCLLLFYCCARGYLVEDELVVLKGDALSQVDVGTLAAAELGTEDGDVGTTLNGEGDVLSGLREVCLIPLLAHHALKLEQRQRGKRKERRTTTTPNEAAVVVAEDGVEVELDGLAVLVGTEDVVLVHADVLDRLVEGHDEGCGCWLLVREE